MPTPLPQRQFAELPSPGLSILNKLALGTFYQLWHITIAEADLVGAPGGLVVRCQTILYTTYTSEF